MTYIQLLQDLLKLAPERFNDTVTVFDPNTEEFIAVAYGVECDDAIDVLDDGHYYMTLKA